MTSYGINSIAKFIESNLSFCQYVRSGVTQKIDIRRIENTGNKIRVLIYFDSTVAAGNITKVQLIDKAGGVFDEKNDVYPKPDKKGLMIAFDYTISEVI